jgi:exopolyphosphatase/guanosine-5'-triphosphate,3'-diphosphate pyrophosphatase
VVASKSLDIGSVRMLHDRVQPSEWKTMKAWLKDNTTGLKPLYGIGTGGNISKIFRLARIKEGKPIPYGVVQRYHRYLSSFTLEERITQLGMKPDRADVIVLASEVYLSVMKWAKIRKMFVPQIGLADGIIHVLYDRFKQQN